MCNINLLPHNEVAYRKVKEKFKISDRACVIHATGTGKSYIIAAIAEDYNKVLILAPNNYVLSELGKTVGSNCKLMTYQGLSIVDDINFMKSFDLIILDEFHRTGAEVWGEKVKELLDLNPGIKVLGTTATEVRTDGRNMADEMFEGNVVSRLTLPMAWSQHILKVPTYVTGLYTFDNIEIEMRNKITKSNKSDKEKMVSLAELDSIRLDWINSRGTDSIIKKYINPDSRRIIVFCDKIKYVRKMKDEVRNWIENAGLTIHKIYTVNSKNKNSEKNMIDFEKGNYKGVKVMLAVNMLNEGIHTKDIDSVIMLRPTSSKIIYLQQMGRCMNLSSKTSPVIFDLVDNLSSTSHLYSLSEELRELEDKKFLTKKRYELKERVEFSIIDNLTETRQLIEKLSDEFTVTYHSFEENLEELKVFCEANNRLPLNRDGEKRLETFYRKNKSNNEISELISKYKQLKSFDENLSELKEFVAKYDRLTRLCKEKEENRLRGFLNKYRYENEINKLVDKYMKIKFRSFEDNLSDLKEFVKSYNKLPQPGKSKSETRMRAFLDRNKDHQEVMNIFKRYKKGNLFEENLDDLKEFVSRYNRLPQAEKGESRLKSFMTHYKANPKVSEIISQYSRKGNSFEENLIELREFVKLNNRTPRYGKENEGRLYGFISRYKSNPEVSELINQYKCG